MQKSSTVNTDAVKKMNFNYHFLYEECSC